jgi:flagellar hook-associated protein 3 FlgL
MRVSTQMYPQGLLSQLGKLTDRQQKLQQQVATGVRVQSVSDDPAAARKMMGWQQDLTSVEQYRKNLVSQQDLAKANHNLVGSLNTIMTRVNELAFKSNGIESKETLGYYSEEINGLIERAADTVNSRFNGEYLLSGSVTQTPPFEFERDEKGKIIGATFRGNQFVRQTEIAEGRSVSAQWVGANDGTGDQPGLMTDAELDIDFFRDLVTLRDQLAAGNTEAIHEQTLEKLGQLEDHLLHFTNANGAMQTRLQTSETLLRDQEEALSGMLSREGDADMAETIVRLNEIQYAYQAALQSGAKIMGSSLMNYLR